MLRRSARGRGGIGRAPRRRAGGGYPRRRVWAARGLALFGVLGMVLATVVATWPVDVAPRAAAAVAAPDLFFPKPSQGPPRQFPLTPTPNPPPTKPAPPSPPPPPPSRPAPPSSAVPKPKPRPPAPVTPPKPSPSRTPTRTPAPTPAAIPPLPAAAFHVPPHKQLSRVLVVFVVGIVPVSLGRIRR